MHYHKQMILHDPKNGRYGDCYRTAVACLLELPLDEVPHVFNDPNGDPDEQQYRMDSFLSGIGVARIWMAHDGALSISEILKFGANQFHGLDWLLSGTSPRGSNHSVICKDDQMVHDPSPFNGYLIGPAQNNTWLIELLVRPLQPNDHGLKNLH